MLKFCHASMTGSFCAGQAYKPQQAASPHSTLSDLWRAYDISPFACRKLDEQPMTLCFCVVGCQGPVDDLLPYHASAC